MWKRTRRGCRAGSKTDTDKKLSKVVRGELHTMGLLLDGGQVSPAQYDHMQQQLKLSKRSKHGDLQVLQARTEQLKAEARVLVETAKQTEKTRLEVCACVCVCVCVCVCMQTQLRECTEMMLFIDTLFGNRCSAVYTPVCLADVMRVKAGGHQHAFCCGSVGHHPLYPLGYATPSHIRGCHGGAFD